MNTFALYVRYALRSFIRGRTRSLFGAFCVAVGVASVIALGLTGANFRSAATGNAQKLNRGDVSATPAGNAFTLKQYAVFARMKAQGKLADYTAKTEEFGLMRNSQKQATSAIGSISAVDPTKFPFYDTITANQPSGSSLASLLANSDSAVISSDAATVLDIGVGGRVAFDSPNGFTHTYTVTGIVPDNANDTSIGLKASRDIVMVNPTSTLSYFHARNIGATAVYIKTRDAAQAAGVKAQLEHTLGSLATVKTAADAARDARATSKGFDQFFSIMGLVAVVIGGIGIVNTMLVAARRRTKEIAVLKSLGMKGREVVFVFTLESFILALAGTVMGIVLGIAASLVVNKVTEGVTGNPLAWSLHIQPIIAGIAVGLVATVLFSYIPVLRASSARPVAALRNNGASMPKAGRIKMTLLVLGLASLMGYLAVLYTELYSGVQAVIYGVMAGIGTLLVAGLLMQNFVLLVWLASKLPSFGRLSARLAFRNLGTQKRRQGSTLLALCIGILAVGSSALLAQNIKSSFAGAVEGQQKLNVAVQTAHDPVTIRRLNAVVAALPGIQHRDDGAAVVDGSLASVNGHSTVAILQRRLAQHKVIRDNVLSAASKLQGIEGRNLEAGAYALTMKAGRNLSKRDIGTDHLVVPSTLSDALGIKVGSRFVYSEGTLHVPFTVVGIYDAQKPSNFTLFAANEADLRYLQRMRLTTPSPAHLSVLYLQIRSDVRTADTVVLRRAFPRALVLDLSNFLDVVNKAIDQFALFPEIIAALSLFAGATIIGNTVALAMLERRKELGVMKAVGAKRRSILQFLLVESIVIGFLGALVGVLLAMVATVLLDQFELAISSSFDLLTIAGLLLLGIGLAIGASALTAFPASGEKPMNVLRYE
jgi:ABC-type antimicrobial peptide transport system permease subunit